jgi:hypothetical protein
MLMGFDPKITGIASQPFWLHWQDGDGRARRHAPDFFARRADGSAVVVDVRPDDRIPLKDAEVFRVTALACGQAGWEIRRAGTIDPVLRANVRWLSRYRHPRCRREPVDTGVSRSPQMHRSYQSMLTVSSACTHFRVNGSNANTSSRVVSITRYSPGRVGRSLP